MLDALWRKKRGKKLAATSLTERNPKKAFKLARAGVAKGSFIIKDTARNFTLVELSEVLRLLSLREIHLKNFKNESSFMLSMFAQFSMNISIEEGRD